MPTGAAIDGYAQVFRVLDALKASSNVAPGLRGSIFSAIDQLRVASAPAEHVAIAERISATMHQLEWALHKSNGERQACIRQQLRALNEAWLATPAPRN
ncbi:MAG: hypothetical protein FP826_10740 [Sphingomonadales bacterium]|nr:hypothetical protein [Sphingomonadales bacterium]MBU3993196.1 hypothetical protein [Alphaproteobacteria bacterium]